MTNGAMAAVAHRPMTVDAHHHVWDLTVRDQPWTAGMPTLRRSFSLDDFRPDLAANHVDRTVVVQTVGVEEETPELLSLAENSPEIAGVVGWVDLCAVNVADQLAALRQRPGGTYLVGVRHLVQDEPDPYWLCRPEVHRGLRAVGDAGLVYDLLVRHYQLPAAIETVAALGEVRFVLDHGAKPDIANGVMEPWQAQVVELSGMPNIAVKLSGLVTEANHDDWTVEQIRPYADVLVDAFGADRTMWGSDWPVCLLAATYEEVLATAKSYVAAMSPGEREEIFGGTALRWYSLETSQSGGGQSGGVQ
jgi:L-fuconolactonase